MHSFDWFSANNNNILCKFLLQMNHVPKTTQLTLLVPGQGHNGPGNWNTVCPIHKIRARPIKILDFVPFYVWMVLENSFLEFVFETFVKLKKKFLIEGSPLWKKIEDIKKYFFSRRIKLFLFESLLYTFLASFWGI